MVVVVVVLVARATTALVVEFMIFMDVVAVL